MRATKKTYKLLAGLMAALLFTGLLQVEFFVVNLAYAAGFFLACGSVLLYSLMKLDVMEFQKGSSMERLNRRVNGTEKRERKERAQMRALRRQAYAITMATDPSYLNC